MIYEFNKARSYVPVRLFSPSRAGFYEFWEMPVDVGNDVFIPKYFSERYGKGEISDAAVFSSELILEASSFRDSDEVQILSVEAEGKTKYVYPSPNE